MPLISAAYDRGASLSVLAAAALTWQSTTLMAVLLTVCTALDIIAGWQARRTLAALARAAPAGVVTIRQNASRGQAIRLVWASDSHLCRRPSGR